MCAGVWITTEKTDNAGCSISETHKTVVEILQSGRLRYYPAGTVSFSIKDGKFVARRIDRRPKLATNSLKVTGKEGKRALTVKGTGGTSSLHQWRLAIQKSTDSKLLFRQRSHGLSREQCMKSAHL